jgi:hypothetical protein
VVRVKVEVTDAGIADATALALKLRPGIPPSVQATVHDGHVTLTDGSTGCTRRSTRRWL